MKIRKSIFTILMACLLIISGFTSRQALSSTPPDEGMWLPIFVEKLNYGDMKNLGLKLTAEEIYSINNSSIKDAIVGLSNSTTPSGFFCTGEIVSGEGLMFTNHHCGFDRIQQHSTIEHDYLKDGFWAMSKKEELPNEGLTATFFERMEEVTDSIVPFLSDTMSEADRGTKIREITSRLKEAASEDGRYHTVVKGFFGGSEYYLFVYSVYKDVRLVGAPPSAIGKFGGDTDNWMWPRHTGDFSIFRVYTAPDGSSAEYSEESIPLSPKHFLPISLNGVKKDDFSMIWGYPGGTDRYMTSYGIEFQIDYFNPLIIEILGAKLKVWKEFMNKDREVAIQYASKYSGLSNFWKYSIGQNKGLKRLDVYNQKKEIEEDFTSWAMKDSDREEKYGDVLSGMEESYKQVGEVFKSLAYGFFAGSGGAEIFELATDFRSIYGMLEEKTDQATVKESLGGMQGSIEEHFKNYSAKADRKLFATMMKLYHDRLPVEMQPQELTDLIAKYDGDFNAMADYVFENSMFDDEEELMAFVKKPKFKTLDKDPAYKLAVALQNNSMQSMGAYRGAQSSLGKNERLFIQGLREMNPDKVFYPDANSTMRLSYGTVQDYVAADAVEYDYITHLYGVMEKEDPANNEFIVPDKLKELYGEKDYGVYGKDGKMIVCFLTNHDITGGNSGSPVINGNGELVGIAFDGNWEAMSGDIAFEPEVQRTISVDIRYVLFIIDKYAGAQNLIDELTIAPKARKISVSKKELLEKMDR